MAEYKKERDILQNLLLLSQRSPCIRGKVACAILDSKGDILADGYNFPPGEGGVCGQMCTQFFGVDRDRCGSVHAEQIALINLKELDRASKIITTCEPCWACLKMICATPIKKLYYQKEYSNADREKHLGFWVKSGRKAENYIRLSS